MKRLLVGLTPWVLILIGCGYFIHDWNESRKPASEWMRVDRILIDDVREGSNVYMFVDREIKKDFTATWHVSVRKIDQGKLEIVCTSSGGGLYRREATLPSPLTLNWWTFPVRCDLGQGTYIVDTAWHIKDGTRTRTVVRSSNRFSVLPRL